MTNLSFPQSVVAFIDILGFAQMVSRDKASATPAYLPKIKSIIDTAVDGASGQPVALRNFSDSIVLSCPYSASSAMALLQYARSIQQLGLENGVLFRGGISYGRHYADARVIYSPGLISSYRIETTLARVPRIVVDSDLLTLLEGEAEHSTEVRDALEAILITDRDLYAFVNYLDLRDVTQLTKARTNIEGLIHAADVRNPGLFEKYQWLCEYYNDSHKRLHGATYQFSLPSMIAYRCRVAPAPPAATSSSVAADDLSPLLAKASDPKPTV